MKLIDVIQNIDMSSKNEDYVGLNVIGFKDGIALILM